MSSMPQSVVIDLIDSLTGCLPSYQGSHLLYQVRSAPLHQGVDLPLKTGDPVYATFCGRVRESRTRAVRQLSPPRQRLETIAAIFRSGGRAEPVGQRTDHRSGGSTTSTGPSAFDALRPVVRPRTADRFKNGILSRETFLLKNRSSASIRTRADFDDEIANEEQDKQGVEAAEKAAMKYHRIKSIGASAALTGWAAVTPAVNPRHGLRR